MGDDDDDDDEDEDDDDDEEAWSVGAGDRNSNLIITNRLTLNCLHFVSFLTWKYLEQYL